MSTWSHFRLVAVQNCWTVQNFSFLFADFASCFLFACMFLYVVLYCMFFWYYICYGSIDYRSPTRWTLCFSGTTCHWHILCSDMCIYWRINWLIDWLDIHVHVSHMAMPWRRRSRWQYRWRWWRLASSSRVDDVASSHHSNCPAARTSHDTIRYEMLF